MLDNPIWHSLQTDHARFARGGPRVFAYPHEVAPFASVAADGLIVSAPELDAALGDATAVYFVHQIPLFAPDIEVDSRPPIVQMTWRQQPLPSATVNAARIQDLGPTSLDAMVDLTSRVFPGYFRTRTPEMGRYVGILHDGRLAAMGGERMSMTGFREVSAVCTDPAFTGRGYAHAIVRHIVERLADEGVTPFLHVNAENARARAVYRTVGFLERSEAVKLLRVRRPGARPAGPS